MFHKKTVNYIDPNKLHVGRVPPVSEGEKFQRAFQNLRAWREMEAIARYSGRPEFDVNGNPTSSANSLYVFSRFPERADSSDRQVRIDMGFWAKASMGGAVTAATARQMDWYNDWTDGAADATLSSFLHNITNDTLYGSRSGTSEVLIGNVTPQSSVFADSDMETAGVGSWTVGVPAGALSKETASPYSGTQSLRITYSGAANPSIYQSVFTIGRTYRIRGWARGDGTFAPYLTNVTGPTIWTGTSSTNWQYFDVTFVALHARGSALRGNMSAAGYVEFDDITVLEYEGFHVSKLDITYCYLSNMTVSTMPETTLTDAQGYFVKPNKFITYEALRGSTSGTVGDSVGRMAWGLERGDSAVQATHRCLFQTTYPKGAFVGSAGTPAPFQSDASSNPLRYKVTPRNLQKSSSPVECDVAIVVNTATAGDTIEMVSSTAGDTWTYTVPAGGIATPTAITTANGSGGGTGGGLLVAAAGDLATVRAQGADVHCNTFSLWEGERI
jgi:hypothetical protein